MKGGTLTRVLLAGAVLAALAAATAWAASSATGDEPLTAARFSITIDGYEIASFSELAGIVSTAGQEDLTNRTGAQARAVPPTVTLKRGLVGSDDLWEWLRVAQTSRADALENAVLTAYDLEGRPVARFHLENAWPARVEVNGLKAGSSEVLMETVTLVCDHIQRVNV